MKNKKAVFVTYAAVIAALYVSLSYVSGVFGLSFGPLQFRLSEVLTVLPVFTPAAIPGLAIGCAIANFASPFGVADICFGAFATFTAACATYSMRKITFKGLPLLSLVPPVLINATVIGLEICLMQDGGAAMFFTLFAQIALGQSVMCVVLGIPFIHALKHTKVF